MLYPKDDVAYYGLHVIGWELELLDEDGKFWKCQCPGCQDHIPSWWNYNIIYLIKLLLERLKFINTSKPNKRLGWSFDLKVLTDLEDNVGWVMVSKE